VWYTIIVLGIVWIVRWWKKGNTLGGTLIRDEPIPIIPLPRENQPVFNHIQINNLNVNNGSISMIQGRDVEMEVGPPQRVRQRSIPPPELRPFFADDAPDQPLPPQQVEEEEEEEHQQQQHQSLPVIQESVFSSDEEVDESSYHPPPRRANIRPRHQSTPNATGPAFHTRRRRQ
jgi:hypothetical protein